MPSEKVMRRISRVEFIPANFASLVIALAWAYDNSMDPVGLILPMFLALVIISFVSIAGAHLNTFSDSELDKKDPTKGALVEALTIFGRKRLRSLIVLEILASALAVALLFWIVPRLGLPALYGAAIFFAYAYSMPPFRFKGRSILAMISLMLILSIIPITFTYLVISPALDPLFLLFLAGQCMIIYGLIIPTEIRDHDWDKGMGISTMTVWLGFGMATLLGISLMTGGLILMGAAFVMQSLSMGLALLAVCLVIPVLTIGYVIKQYFSIRSLITADEGRPAMGGIVALASKNPRWITLVSQSIVLICLVLIVAKILF